MKKFILFINYTFLSLNIFSLLFALFNKTFLTFLIIFLIIFLYLVCIANIAYSSKKKKYEDEILRGLVFWSNIIMLVLLITPMILYVFRFNYYSILILFFLTSCAIISVLLAIIYAHLDVPDKIKKLEHEW